MTCGHIHPVGLQAAADDGVSPRTDRDIPGNCSRTAQVHIVAGSKLAIALGGCRAGERDVVPGPKRGIAHDVGIATECDIVAGVGSQLVADG